MSWHLSQTRTREVIYFFDYNSRPFYRFHCLANGESVYLHTLLSEQLLERLCLRKRMSGDSIMTLFKGDTTRLQHVRVLDASTLTVKGLEVLKEHKIQDLEIHYLLDVSRLLDQCLSEWSLANLRSLNVRRSDHPINEYTYQFSALRKYVSSI